MDATCCKRRQCDKRDKQRVLEPCLADWAILDSLKQWITVGVRRSVFWAACKASPPQQEPIPNRSMQQLAYVPTGISRKMRCKVACSHS